VEWHAHTSSLTHITPEICKEFLVNPELQQQTMKGQEEQGKMTADYNGCILYDFDMYRKVGQDAITSGHAVQEKGNENLLLQSCLRMARPSLKMITYGPNCSNSSTLRPNKKVLKQP
jgi:hypothetical protein